MFNQKTKLFLLSTPYKIIPESKPSESGQGILEYALIFSFVVILLVVLLYFFGNQVEFTYQSILDSLPF